jgi:mannose-1-phosphate guanylyltransferase
LWPRSRRAHPKQFTDIAGAGCTMIQATVGRLAGLTPLENIFVVTGPDHAELASGQLPQLPSHHILIEPSGRNTAPAIGLACVHVHRREPEAVVAILPADHIISQVHNFQAALRRAATAAQAGYLVTLGIQPTAPHTGYGYLRRGQPITDAEVDASNEAGATLPVYTVERFLEKPDRATAEEFLRQGGYYWNGGIFVCRVDVMLGEIERQMPDMYAALRQIACAVGTAHETHVLQQVWPQMRAISIDYGVMEGAHRVAVTPLDAGWNDVGSWDALESVLERDGSDNFSAQSNTLAVDSWGNLVFSQKAVVALVGVDDLVIVEDEDALLIGHKHQMQKVKTVVEQLRQRKRDDLV